MRTDIHRPSAIKPEDYMYVGVLYEPRDSFDLGELEYAASERRRVLEFMERTGAKYSTHEHGGTCHICGAWAAYRVVFHHPATNVLIMTGSDCAEKMEMDSPEVFRTIKAIRGEVKDAKAFKAGKQKAQAILGEMGIPQAFEYAMNKNALRIDHEAPYEVRNAVNYPLDVVSDIIGSLIRYGSLSEKQGSYLKAMTEKLEMALGTADEKLQEAADKEAARADVVEGRRVIEGTVLTTKVQDSFYGSTLKMLVEEDDGARVWGTVPGSINHPERGERVRFTATVERSEDDARFGFFKRPAKAEIIETEEV